MKTYTTQHRDAPVSVYDRIKSARQAGRLEEAQRMVHEEINRRGGQVSSRLADEWALLHMAAYQWEEARNLFAIIASKFPDQPLVWRNIGQCSEIMGDYQTACDAYRESVQCFKAKPGQPDEARAWFGLGAQLFRIGLPEVGEAWWREGLTKNATSADAKYQRSQVLLALGQYEEGWREFESRKQLRGYNDGIAARGGMPALPEWDGKSRGLVRCVMSQGAGDAVMFARYLPLITEASGYTPEINAGGPLERWLGEYAHCKSLRAEENDFVAHLDSMPLLLRRPEPIPPRCANPWRRPSNPLPRVGICWKGSDKHLNDKDRSCPYDPRRSLSIDRWELVSLQVGEGFAPRDYQETADLMRTLDAVLTVDTSVVHVAGTLGVPTVLIPPSCPEWRWGLRSEATPWYPSVTIVRRRSVTEWEAAWERAKTTLEGML